MFSMTKYIAELKDKSGFEKLDKREKLIVAIGIGFLLLFVILQFGISPYITAREKLDRSINRKQAELVELKALQQEYQNLKEQAGGIKEKLREREANFSLFSFLDAQATAAGIKELISYMKPSVIETDGELQESVVEMKLQQISLKQLVEFLKGIESPEKSVFVKRLSIQESGKEQGLLEVIMQIVTFVNID